MFSPQHRWWLFLSFSIAIRKTFFLPLLPFNPLQLMLILKMCAWKGVKSKLGLEGEKGRNDTTFKKLNWYLSATSVPKKTIFRPSRISSVFSAKKWILSSLFIAFCWFCVIWPRSAFLPSILQQILQISKLVNSTQIFHILLPAIG